MVNRTYKILLNKESEGAYTATVPALPRCITYGDNVDHAISMAKEAIELYIENLQENESQYQMIAKRFRILLTLLLLEFLS